MTDSIREAKRAMRKDVLAGLRAQAPEERRRASAALHERLFALEAFRRARGVHCFLSLPEEVDTAPVLARCQAEGKSVFVPHVITEEGRLGIVRWSPELPLVTGRLGVREPAPEARHDLGAGPDALARLAAQIDLVIVPGVAFDRAGGRLGHGKGYYDRFLTEMDVARRGHGDGPAPSVPLRIVLAFPLQIVPEVPVESWDVRMDVLVTPGATLAIGPQKPP